MQTYLSIAQIILSVALILVVLFQVKGGGLGGIFGQQESVYRAKRGLERTMLQMTIILAVLFVIVAIVNVRLA